MKKNINILALAVISFFSSCSDNYTELYEPTWTAKSLIATSKSANFSESDKVLTFAAVRSTAKIEVTGNTRWSVKVDNSEGWCEVSTYNGSGNGSFEISVLENISDEIRRCSVRIVAIDESGNELDGDDAASYMINVIQNNSRVRMTPSSLQPFISVNPEPQNFEIIADDNVKWTLTISYEEQSDGENVEFIKILPVNGKVEEKSSTEYTGVGSANFTMTLETNRIAADRVGFLLLESEGSAGTITVQIRQIAGEYNFDVSLDDFKDLPAEGGTLKFGVYSPQLDWEIQGVPEWVSFDKSNGTHGSDRIQVTAIVAPNSDYNNKERRTADISFVPVGENADLYQKYSFKIVQEASPMPAVSIPWILNFTNSEADIEFNYYSPIQKIESAGVQWKLYDENDDSDSGWNEMEDTDFTAGQTSGFVNLKIVGLKTVTTYLIRGYVKNSEGVTTYSKPTEPFTTAGVRPGDADNPTPGT